MDWRNEGQEDSRTGGQEDWRNGGQEAGEQQAWSWSSSQAGAETQRGETGGARNGAFGQPASSYTSLSSSSSGTSLSSNTSSSTSSWTSVSSTLGSGGRVTIETQSKGKEQNQGAGGRKQEQGVVDWDGLVDGVFTEEIAKFF